MTMREIKAYVNFIRSGEDVLSQNEEELRLVAKAALAQVCGHQKLTALSDATVSEKANFDRLAAEAADVLAAIHRHLAAKSVATYEAIEKASTDGERLGGVNPLQTALQ